VSTAVSSAVVSSWPDSVSGTDARWPAATMRSTVAAGSVALASVTAGAARPVDRGLAGVEPGVLEAQLVALGDRGVALGLERGDPAGLRDEAGVLGLVDLDVGHGVLLGLRGGCGAARPDRDVGGGDAHLGAVAGQRDRAVVLV
jgi:hypothetical protein